MAIVSFVPEEGKRPLLIKMYGIIYHVLIVLQ